MSSQSTFDFTSRFANNAVIVIDLLDDNDLQTARRLAEDLDSLRMSDGTTYCHYEKVKTAEDLKAYLDWIDSQCKLGLRPIVHFEAHGNKDDGLLIGNSGQWIGWGEVSDYLLRINTTIKNNLGIVMASCFGLYAISTITIKKPTPFYFLIGSTATVPAGYIQDNMIRFYRSLFDKRSLDDAMLQVEEQFRQFHAERFFCIAFGKYLKQKCMGQGAAKRVESMISTVFESGVHRSRSNLRALRRSAKAFVKSSDRQRDAFYASAKYFLHGKVPMDFDEFERFVKRR